MMKPRLESAPLTPEDDAISWRQVMRGPLDTPYLPRFAYRVADRKDAMLMLCFAFVIPLGPGPRARILEFFSVDGLLHTFSKDRGMVHVPERDIRYFA